MFLSHNSIMKNSFSKNVREYRRISSLTQTDLANKLKTTQRKVSYWESGKIEPDLDTLIAIAELFDITVDDLIGKNNDK